MDRLHLLLSLSVALFAIGLLGVIVRRNLLVMLMCMELMLNGVILSLVTFAHLRAFFAELDATTLADLVAPAAPGRARRVVATLQPERQPAKPAARRAAAGTGAGGIRPRRPARGGQSV